MPESKELLAAGYDVEAMSRHIGVDSLAFISIDGLYRAVGGAPRDAETPRFCDACFTGEYPVPLTDRDGGPETRQLSLLADQG